MSDAEIYQKIQTGDYIVPIKEACQRDGVYSESYPTGYDIFDQAMKVDAKDNGGVRDGDLVIITGISGHGKTTFSQNIALNLNKIAIPSLFFSYEVIIDNLYAKFRLMGFSDDGVLYCPKKIITGNLKWIQEKVREAKEKYYAKAIFIDHIDFLTVSSNRNSDQLRMALRNICQELKTIAIKEEVIIFLMAHVKKVENREVQMQDIAESAGVFQLADYVFSIARGIDYVQSGNKTIEIVTDEGIIKMLKNRLTGRLPYMKFAIKDNIIRRVYEGS